MFVVVKNELCDKVNEKSKYLLHTLSEIVIISICSDAKLPLVKVSA